jgi:DNA repair exonuclease SbcCD nuclease subunit
MSKVVVISDTHYGFKRSSKIFHDYFEAFYEEVFFPYLEENNIDTIIHMGDVFDNRRSIDYTALEWSKRVVFDKLKNYTVHMLVGNHDIYYNNTNKINSPELLLSDYSNFQIYNSISEIEIDNKNFILVPWICDDNYQEVQQMLQETNAEVCFGHLELNGFKLSKNMTMEDGHDKGLFSKFKKVFSGHFHTRSSDGKIFYIGNPYQMFSNDVNDDRGFIVFDTETYEHTYIDNPFEIFCEVYYTDDLELTSEFYGELEEYVHNKIIKLIVKNKKDHKKYQTFFDRFIDFGFNDLKVIENYDVNFDSTSIVDESNDTLTVLYDYIDNIEEDVNKNEIKKIISEIYTKANVME